MELIIHGDAATAKLDKIGFGWSTVETDMYRNPKAVDRIRSSLSKINVPACVNVMFDERGTGMFAMFTDEQKAELTSLMHPGMINFFVRNNSGSASRHNPLTPWILLHRMHHAFEITGRHHLPKGVDRTISTGDTVMRAESEIRKVLGVNSRANVEANYFALACTMRSARIRQLYAFNIDIAAELFAQYHTTGDIKFQGLDAWQFDSHNSGEAFLFRDEMKGKFRHFYVSKRDGVAFTQEQKAAVDEILARYKPILIEAIKAETEMMKMVPIAM